ncbi:MAG: hypothetical protein AAF626_07785 [Pseudomonadota bacterium]
MKSVGQLTEVDGRYEFRLPKYSLLIRGDHPEWVMQAASEVVATVAKNESDGRIDELETLFEFEEASEIELSAAKFAVKERFEVIPQCLVSMGRVDYKWVAPLGREKLQDEFDGMPYKRIADMSLRKHDSFLENDPDVSMSREIK